MANRLSNLSITDRNTDIPFFPSIAYHFLNSDFGVENPNIPTFNWIQAFFDSTFAATPVICVGTGNLDASGNPIVSEIQFAFSGERVAFKGQFIYMSGTNIRGQAVTSAGIGGALTSTFTRVIAYGGMN